MKLLSTDGPPEKLLRKLSKLLTHTHTDTHTHTHLRRRTAHTQGWVDLLEDPLIKTLESTLRTKADLNSPVQIPQPLKGELM